MSYFYPGKKSKKESKKDSKKNSKKDSKNKDSKNELTALEEEMVNLSVSSTSIEDISQQPKSLSEPAHITRSITKDWKNTRTVALKKLDAAKNDAKDSRYLFMDSDKRYAHYMYVRDYYLGKSQQSNKRYNFNHDKKGHLTVNALDEYMECYLRYIEELDTNLSEDFNVDQLEKKIFHTEMLVRTKKYFSDHVSYQKNLLNAYYAHIRLPKDHHVS